MLLWSGGAPGAKGDTLEDKPRITPYLPAGDGPFACIVVCPGGGYGGRAAHEGAPICKWLNSIGVAGFVLDYRVKPYRHPIPLGDAQRAIRTVRARAAEWKIDPKRIGILGFSAGGHLAASATTIFDDGKPDAADPIGRQSCRPDAAILCYPVITFGDFRHNGSMVNLLGPDPDPKLRQEMSLETRVTPQTPPTFLWHTSDDGGVPVENSLLFATALRKNKVPFALHVFPRGPHGIGLGDGDRGAKAPDARQWPAICAEWLKNLGFAAK
ncbi:MAG: alpha/beta hydrolase [Planctomycetota bacterium]|nr:alpha/beta hydrolase [Planctomycetota bacterium]